MASSSTAFRTTVPAQSPGTIGVKAISPLPASTSTADIRKRRPKQGSPKSTDGVAQRADDGGNVSPIHLAPDEDSRTETTEEVPRSGLQVGYNSGVIDVHGHSRDCDSRELSIGPFRQVLDFDFNTYMANKGYQKTKGAGQMKVPPLYNKWDAVSNPKALAILYHITGELQWFDECVAELFKAMLPSLAPADVQQMLSDAEATIAASDQCQASALNSQAPKTPPKRPIYLGELGLHIKAISESTPSSLKACRLAAQRLGYLQDALEIPYWDMITDLFLIVISTSTETGWNEKMFLKAVAGCYQDVKQQLRRIEALYYSGEIAGPTPNNIFGGIKLRLEVLEKFTAAVGPLLLMEALSPIDTQKRDAVTAPTRDITTQGEQVATFSILFVVLVLALIPGMKGFSKAVEDGATGTINDADFFVLIRDVIMAVLGVALTAVPMIKSPRSNSAYVMACVFLGAVIVLGVAALALYSLVNKCWSSLCGFLMQYFAMASLTILGLDGVPRGKENGSVLEAGKSSQEKKDQ